MRCLYAFVPIVFAASELGAQRLAPTVGSQAARVTEAPTRLPAYRFSPAAPSESTGFRTFRFVITGAVIGGVIGGLVGRANAPNCEREGCIGYETISDLTATVQGALIGIPIGGIAGFIVARARGNRAAERP